MKYNSNYLEINHKSTLIILDWDDTLFPTSWTVSKNIDLINPLMRKKYIQNFHDLDIILSSLLTALSNYGTIVIITNAMPEWIELSSSVLPKTKKILQHLEVISAREMYQSTYNMSEWKKLAFKYLIFKHAEKNRYNNLLSIGDADYEHVALVALYDSEIIPNKYMKSIKFVRSPEYEVLLDELRQIEKDVKYICKSPRHLDLEFK